MSYTRINKRGRIGRNSGRPFNLFQPRRRPTNRFRRGRIQRRPYGRIQGHFRHSFLFYFILFFHCFFFDSKLIPTYLKICTDFGPRIGESYFGDIASGLVTILVKDGEQKVP